MARSAVRVGLVGARAPPRPTPAPAHLRGSRAELVAVAASTRRSAEGFAGHHGIPVALDDYRVLLERADVD